MEKSLAKNTLYVFCLLLLLSPVVLGVFSSLQSLSLYLFGLWVLMIAYLFYWSKKLRKD